MLDRLPRLNFFWLIYLTMYDGMRYADTMAMRFYRVIGLYMLIFRLDFGTTFERIIYIIALPFCS